MYHAMKAKEILITMTFFVRFNFRKHRDLNRKKHETKNEQIVEKTSFQRIRSVLSKTKKQHELIREKKVF